MGRPRALIVAAAVAVAGVVLAAAVVRPASSSSARPEADAATAPRGCRVVASDDGYPASYIARPVTYRAHPPLPVAGWRAPGRGVRFQVLFHSLFHGYLVITYPPDLPAPSRTELVFEKMLWSCERIVATPTRVPGTAWIDAAEWGWELRCNRVAPTRAELDRFAALRTT